MQHTSMIFRARRAYSAVTPILISNSPKNWSHKKRAKSLLTGRLIHTRHVMQCLKKTKSAKLVCGIRNVSLEKESAKDAAIFQPFKRLKVTK